MGFSFKKMCSNVVPVSTYKAQITEIKFKESSDKSTQYNMEVHYAIAEGEFAKRTLIDTIYEKAFSFRLKPFLNAIGADFNREFETAKELYDYGIRQAKGKFVMIEVGIRSYNGNEYNEVKNWAPIPSSTTTAEDVMAEFNVNPSEVLPKTPRLSDFPDETASADFAPVADVAADDLPF